MLSVFISLPVNNGNREGSKNGDGEESDMGGDMEQCFLSQTSLDLCS